MTFNFAKNADEKCAKGAVVAKFVDGNCVVMGKQDNSYAKPFEYPDKSNGIIITYIGEKCLNSYTSNYKTHFKIICDEKVSEFRVTDVSSCEVNLEKRDPAGCKYVSDQSLVLFSILL